MLGLKRPGISRTVGVIAINYTRIDRTDKNRMRGNLEEILRLEKQIEKQIESYLQSETVEPYKNFWQDLKKQYHLNIQNTHNFMVRKCNR